LGVPQDSLFYWGETSGKVFYKEEFIIREDKISAFTVSELGELLPPYIKVDGQTWQLTIVKFESGNAWGVSYKAFYPTSSNELYCDEGIGTMADVFGKMLIYLKSNGLTGEGE
jgi:hypothetical protein